MATLWKQSSSGQFEPVGLSETSVAPAAGRGTDDPLRGGRIVPFREGMRPSHALIAPADVATRVNGHEVIGRICVLHHKDELLVGSQRMFFSSESTPVVETYTHGEARRRPRCPVCRAEIQDGQTVVRCPGCSRIYHQIAASGHVLEKPCWTYAPACRFCEHPTSMSGEPMWRPSDEEE